jgi:DNA (cytosine-5)-methyltransferase 1
MRELHLFAGAGGGILGGMLLGHTPVCAVELDAYCRKVLQARQADGWLPQFPIYEDVREFDGTAWRGRVDVVAGGFPCQPWSQAGKQKGADDPRHLWPEMARIVEEVRPRYVFSENVLLAALEEPWRDLRGLGYRVPPALCVAAADVGAPHLRKRWWLLATDANSQQIRQLQGRRHGSSRADQAQPRQFGGPEWWATEPAVGRVVNGLAHRVDRLRALGNGQVPMAAATAWHYLMQQLGT